jgi:hypothetical protein
MLQVHRDTVLTHGKIRYRAVKFCVLQETRNSYRIFGK